VDYHTSELGSGIFCVLFQVLANRLGSSETEQPFSMVQLKIVQQVITLIVFVVFSVTISKT